VVSVVSGAVEYNFGFNPQRVCCPLCVRHQHPPSLHTLYLGTAVKKTGGLREETKLKIISVADDEEKRVPR